MFQCVLVYPGLTDFPHSRFKGVTPETSGQQKVLALQTSVPRDQENRIGVRKALAKGKWSPLVQGVMGTPSTPGMLGRSNDKREFSKIWVPADLRGSY